MKNSLLLLSSLALFGCVSSDIAVENTQPLLESACCVSKVDYPWISLQKTQDLNFGLKPSSPIGDFDTGKSYFTAFEFDAQSGDVEILLRSNMQDKQVAIPRVELLDSQFRTVRTLGSEEFKVVFSDAFARNRFELKTTVNSIETPYMVVYADTQSLGKKVVVPHPAILRAQESGDPMPIVTNPTYLSSTVGQFSLDIETLTLSGKNQKVLASNKADKIESAIDIAKLSDAQQQFYLTSIENAVNVGMLDKALALLDEAKSLNVAGAQEAFIKAVNASK